MSACANFWLQHLAISALTEPELSLCTSWPAIMDRMCKALKSWPQVEAFRQRGHFFEGPQCPVLEALLQGASMDPLPTRLTLLLGLQEVALELELHGAPGSIQQDANLMWHQWRLRLIARRARRFLLGPGPDAEELQLRARIKELNKVLKGGAPPPPLPYEEAIMDQQMGEPQQEAMPFQDH